MSEVLNQRCFNVGFYVHELDATSITATFLFLVKHEKRTYVGNGYYLTTCDLR